MPATQHILLLQALGANLARLEALIEHLPAEAETWHPAPDEWNARETVSHLAAADPLFLGRLRSIETEAGPFLPYFGPARARPDADRPLPASLADFRQAREQVLGFLAQVAPEAWERPATHETQGPTTFALQVQNLINHDLEHLGQLHKALAHWNEQQHA